ncbi:37S ribosomal protein S10, mitochondrial [Wickerhamomyces ciferrii]|uniref:Small ribosomal subunit protein uS10m n=1 Tax=Wickerhamomyces ciferrii (strain ATCC 14091 / BCRC 22168 / CBS 111 / JCM 3599 / NBRC 0793 / NRRL Y-1031 F-60-10) TaxID=1206466 RepID=K0KSH9_WICCF|nr:37S ribosomal protein S10, mitochondrial [Wickerhamomyces ciferrii]CCH44284.1 37S ribosomal protein S10, mitochondrial [Wickerhamomyces ciferrii]
MLRQSIRSFSTSSRLAAPGNAITGKGPLTKPTKIPYNPQVFTKEREAPSYGRPFPINVELNYYAPIRHEQTHGNLVATIELRSYDYLDVEFYGDFISRAAYYLKIPISGVTPKPKKRERWTVIKAPFVHAKTKENYERITHGRIIKCYDSNPEVIDLLVSFFRKHSMPGLGIKVQSYQQESLEFLEELDKTPGQETIDDAIRYEATQTEDAEVRKKVEELLKDPVFKQHLTNNKDQITDKSQPKIEK